VSDTSQPPPVGHVDYNQQVSFPVEIVGGDGVVRRHPFLAAVDLYERRREQALVQPGNENAARVAKHCSRRIAQLRESFYQSFGWGSEAPQHAGSELFGNFAGQVAGLLSTVFPVTGSLDVRITPCGEDVGRFDVEYLLAPVRLTLWVATRQHSAERYAALVGAVERKETPDEEWWIAATTCHDGCAILSAKSAYRTLILGLTPPPQAIMDVPQTPWTAIGDALAQKDYPSAISRCRTMVEQHVFNRRAYQVAALCGAYSGQPELAEDLCMLGLTQWPGDEDLRGACAIHAWRHGRFAKASQHAKEVLMPEWEDGELLFALVGCASDNGGSRELSHAGQQRLNTLKRSRTASAYLKYIGGALLGASLGFATGSAGYGVAGFFAAWIVLHMFYRRARERSEAAVLAHLLDNSVRKALLSRIRGSKQTALPS